MIDTRLLSRYLKRNVKRIASALGVEIRRYHPSAGGRRNSLSQVLAYAAERGFQPAAILDVGAADGTPELYGLFPDACLLLVEPLAEYESALRKLAREFDGEYVLAAAGPDHGEAVIHVHDDLVGSSLLRESRGPEADGQPRIVPTEPLDDTCNARGFAGPYLLKIDVQGAELRVLAGASEILVHTELLVVEASLQHNFEGGPEFLELVSFMGERGFVVWEIFGGHNRPGDGALAQVDLAFVKEDGFFRRNVSLAAR